MKKTLSILFIIAIGLASFILGFLASNGCDIAIIILVMIVFVAIAFEIFNVMKKHIRN